MRGRPHPSRRAHARSSLRKPSSMRAPQEATKGGACVLGWLRGSEGKLSQFYQNNCWVIPPETLHDMEELPGKKQLRAMPPYQEQPDVLATANTAADDDEV